MLYTQLEVLLNVGVRILAQGKGSGWEWLEDMGMKNVAILGSDIGEEKRNSSSPKVSPIVHVWTLCCLSQIETN